MQDTTLSWRPAGRRLSFSDGDMPSKHTFRSVTSSIASAKIGIRPSLENRFNRSADSWTGGAGVEANLVAEVFGGTGGEGATVAARHGFEILNQNGLALRVQKRNGKGDGTGGFGRLIHELTGEAAVPVAEIAQDDLGGGIDAG